MSDTDKRDQANVNVGPLFENYVKKVRGEGNDVQENLADLLADLMHFAADQDDVSFDSALASAETHFAFEGPHEQDA
jgi:hypothetical protein